ncbi:MAG: ion channel, partial [Pseudomonadota bacterium]
METKPDNIRHPFSIVSFTTVGYGDVVVDKGWRILSGFVSINGLLA